MSFKITKWRLRYLMAWIDLELSEVQGKINTGSHRGVCGRCIFVQHSEGQVEN